MRTPNLARQPLQNSRPLWLAVVVLTLLSLVATTANVVELLSARKEERLLSERLAPLEERRTRLAGEVAALDRELAAVSWDKLVDEAAALERVLATRRLVWTELLSNLERVLPWDVRLVTIRPGLDDKGRVVLSLAGISTGREGWLKLIARLFNDAVFSDPVPLSEQAPGATNALGYRFQLRAHYKAEDAS